MGRWGYAVLLFLATAINYLDRATLSVAAPGLQKSFNISPAVMGVVMSAFFWTYLVMQIPAGRLIDRYGPRRVYAAAATIWSSATIAMAWTTGTFGMIAARLGLGVGESFCYPLNAKVTAVWFDKGRRGLVTGIWASGARVGSALSLPIVAWLIASHGWQAAFLVSGVLGLVWLVAWLALYREPPGDTVAVSIITSASSIRWYDLFRYRTVWGMMLGFFCLNFNIYFFTTWFPTYLIDTHHLSLKEMGAVGLVPGLIAIPAGWLGGYASDALYQRGWSLTAARKTCLVGGLLMSSVIALAPLHPSVGFAITLLSISYSALAFTGAVVWTLPGDVAPTPGYVASIAGIQNMASNLAGILLTTFTGVVLALSGGSFVLPLLVAGGFCILGAFSYLFLVGRIEPLPELVPARAGTMPAHATGDFA